MKHLESTISHLPAAPGLYVIGHEENIEGLETQREYVYVGKTLNMRRRLSEHNHFTELHPVLASYLRRNRHRARIWYTTDIDAKDVDKLERKLIRELKPEYNRVKYAGGVADE